MACIFNRNNINSIILSIVLGTFTLTYTVPVHAQNFGFGLNEAAFLYRLEKMIEKIWKLEKSDNKDKMYDAIIDLKAELEGSCGVKIDLSKYIDNVEKELKNRGFKPPKKQFDSMRERPSKIKKRNIINTLNI